MAGHDVYGSFVSWIVRFLKMPAYRTSPARLAIELNPTDDSGSPTKKRGLVLRSSEELEEYKTIFQYDKPTPLLKTIDGINPRHPRPRKDEESLRRCSR